MNEHASFSVVDIWTKYCRLYGFVFSIAFEQQFCVVINFSFNRIACLYANIAARCTVRHYWKVTLHAYIFLRFPFSEARSFTLFTLIEKLISTVNIFLVHSIWYFFIRYFIFYFAIVVYLMKFGQLLAIFNAHNIKLLIFWINILKKEISMIAS